VLSGIGAEERHIGKQRKKERRTRIVRSPDNQEKQCNDNVTVN
jgi:hypothetical protein